jgi:hypothetical protein
LERLLEILLFLPLPQNYIIFPVNFSGLGWPNTQLEFPNFLVHLLLGISFLTQVPASLTWGSFCMAVRPQLRAKASQVPLSSPFLLPCPSPSFSQTARQLTVWSENLHVQSLLWAWQPCPWEAPGLRRDQVLSMIFQIKSKWMFYHRKKNFFSFIIHMCI